VEWFTAVGDELLVVGSQYLVIDSCDTAPPRDAVTAPIDVATVVDTNAAGRSDPVAALALPDLRSAQRRSPPFSSR
jgi:hypothetical protein